MPKLCHGDAYELGGKYWYRCLEFSAVHEVPAGELPKKCPQCGRPHRTKYHQEPKTRTTVEVFLPKLGWVRHRTTED